MKQEAPDSGLDVRLDQALSRLPDVPVSSNFTARVMQAIDREESRSSRPWLFHRNWHAWLPRAAVAVTAAVFAVVGIHQYELSNHRHQIAASVAMVAGQPLPSVEALKNFDAIQRMSQPAHADDELLALLQ